MKITKAGIAVQEIDDYLSADIEREGRLDVARELILGFKDYIPVEGVVADVGACLGDYTATFSDMVGPDGHVHAFEPHVPALECLRYNMEQYDNVIIYDFALGSEPALAMMDRDFHNLGASQVRLGGGTVSVLPLDTIAQYWSRLDFLKIDSEGFEPMILDGGKDTITRLRPVIFIEISQYNMNRLGLGMTTEDTYRRLETLNYAFDRTDGHDGDILCLPK